MEEKVAPVKPSRPKRHFSSAGTIESVNLDAIPLAIARLDNSAAKHKLSVKPKNQRVSKKHRRLARDRPNEQGGLPRQLSLDQNGHSGEDKPIWHEEEPELLESEEEKRCQEEYWLELEAKCKRQKAEAAERRRLEEQRLQALERRLWEENRRQELLEEEGEDREGEETELQLEAEEGQGKEEKQRLKEQGGQGQEWREQEEGRHLEAQEQAVWRGQEAERQRQLEEQRELKELRRQEELEEQQRQEAEKQQQELEQRQREEQQRLEEEQRQREEQRRLEEEHWQREEQQRLEEEQRRREEEEQRRREEQQRLEEEQRRRDEEQRQREEQLLLVEEQRRLEEEQREREEQRREEEEEEEAATAAVAAAERRAELGKREEVEVPRRPEAEAARGHEEKRPQPEELRGSRSALHVDSAEKPGKREHLKLEKQGENSEESRVCEKQSREAEPSGEQQAQRGGLPGHGRRARQDMRPESGPQPPQKPEAPVEETPAPGGKKEAAAPETDRKVEELRWQEVDERQTMPRPYTFQVSSGGKQILFPKVNLSPVTPVKEAGPAPAAHEPGTPRPSPAPPALPSSLSVPHTAILVTGAQLCGPAVNLSQIKDTACKSLLGLSEEKRRADGPGPEQPPRAAEPRAGSGKARAPESAAAGAALAEWASIRSRILRGAETERRGDGGPCRPAEEPPPRARWDSRGSLRKTPPLNAKFSIKPAWQKFSDGGAETSRRNAEAEGGRRRPSPWPGDASGPQPPATGERPRGADGPEPDATEGCKFAKDLPSFLVPSPPYPPQKAGTPAEAGAAPDGEPTGAGGRPDPAAPGQEEKASPFGIKLRRTNYSLRFHCDQQTEQKKKKRHSSTGDSAEGGPPAGSAPGEETAGAAPTPGPAPPAAWKDPADRPASRGPAAPKPALAPKPAGQTPPSSPLAKLSRPYLVELLARRPGRPEPEAAEPGREARESSAPWPPSPPPAERRKAPRRADEEAADPERKPARPEKPPQTPEAARKEKPVLQSRHSLDGSKLAEKVETAQPLWITLALQKQKGFREQQATREERKQAREAKQAEKLSKENVSVSLQPGSSGVSRAGALHKPTTQLEEKKPETAASRLERREQLKKANTLPTSVTGKMSVTLEDKEDISGNPLLLVSHIRPMELGNSTSIMEPPNNPTFIPTIANEGGKHWTVPEVRALIGIWSDINIQQQLEGTVRNKRIFEQIAAKLQKSGIERDWKQCRTKYKNLKHEYKTVRMAQDQGITKSMKFFTELDAILGYNKREKSQEHKFQDEEQATRCANVKTEEKQSVIAGDAAEDDFVSDTSEDLRDRDVKQSPGTGNYIPLEDAKNHLQIVTVSDTEAGKHWCDNEVRALIHIWSDEKIKQMLERATRNKEIFEEIARRLMQFGIDRDWKQCRTKYKNLKYEYRVLQKKNGNPQRKMRFYEEVDCILRGPTLRTAKWKHELFEGHTKNPRTSSMKRKAHEDGPVPVSLKKTVPEIIANTFPQSVTERKDSTECFYRQKTPYMIQLHQSLASPPGASPAPSPRGIMATAEVLNIGKKLYEGKTKEVYELLDSPGKVLLQSKDQITAGNAARKNHLEGKAAISNKTTSCIFQLLKEAGIKTAFTRMCGETAFIAPKCEMIPIEWVCRRIATGSFLKRNPGVKEGYKFYPPKVELFFKDDANNDPQWSEEQLIAAKFCFAGLVIGQTEVDIMSHATQAIFEILEKSWLPQNCTLVDMKIEFGVDVTTKEIVLADVIDNDSWRLWPSGDRSQQKDKQSYRDLKEVTPEGLQMVKKNFEWVAERVELLLKSESQCRVVVLMGSTSDLSHCEKIQKACGNFGIPCELRVTSAHKGPDETLRIKAEYEGDGIPTVFVAVAGRSNGLGPVMSGNTAYPVISCPPLTPDWGAQDVWSSLRLPSGLGCSTILSPEGSAQFAAQIFGLNNHLVWAKLRASILNTWISLKQADKKIRKGNL
ncbi:capping protein-inhibiting regulator of actin dynamics isoform X6 [Canis lupus baileyi]